MQRSEITQKDSGLVGRAGIAWGRLGLATLFAALAEAVVNAIVYFIASALGAFPDRVTLVGNSPASAGLVVLTSIIGVVAAAIVFAVIGRFSRRPARRFRIVATVALIVSLVFPASIPDAPAGMIATLILMHIVAWASSVGPLVTVADRPTKEA